LLLWFVRQAGMGFGDVRLSALLGCVLGYVGTGPLFIGLYSAFLLFAVPGLVIAIAKRDRSVLKRAYPFGPFLLVGAWLGVVAGEPLVTAIWG
jgi:leader peptidase (prepilin peptidase) / N-methyltransferase